MKVIKRFRIRVDSSLKGLLKAGQLASDDGHPGSGQKGKSGHHHWLEKTVCKSSGTGHFIHLNDELLLCLTYHQHIDLVDYLNERARARHHGCRCSRLD